MTLAYYITNELANEGILIEGISIVTIESIIKAIINEYDNQKRNKPNRYQSVKVHWRRDNKDTWCHTSAKNPRLTTLPDLVTCRRCIPEAIKNKGEGLIVE